jgi:heme/copper-type cytochrome/quinol oxidase subunit 3
MTGTRPVGDLSHLPANAFGLKSLVGWGTLGFMLIEGTGFALAAGAYLYLQTQSHPWPPRGDRPPDLLWSAIFTVTLVLSEIPNRWLYAKSRQCDDKATRWGVVLMSVIGLILLGMRAFELMHLNVRWSDDAYASVVWLLMVLHTSHVVTDLGDTIVIGAWLFTHKVGERQFSDVCDNASYWDFVILSWLPIYALIYWAPRIW